MNSETSNEPIDRLFEQFTRPGSPGCALGIMQGGKQGASYEAKYAK